ncbi:MAG: hypothetical protein EB824_05055 [Thaumarchaeota archaeon S15]|nr:MAG: hypothetical protein EB824_05055 [Thaumarchaeota archaeon S15]
MKAFKKAAIRILEEHKAPLHFKRIADRSMELNLIKLDKNTIRNCMGEILHSDYIEYGSRSAFVAAKTGYYGLNSPLAGPASIKISPIVHKFRQAAIKILREQTAPLHFSKIADIAMETKLIKLDVGTIHSCMGAILHYSVRHKGSNSEFVVTKTGYYGLNPAYRDSLQSPRRAVPTRRGAADPALSSSMPASTHHSGKGGEYLVASKLFFLGYEVYTPSPDTGVDLIANKNDRVPLHIQVKTHTSSTGKYKFHITKSSFERKASSGLFYIFVLRRPIDAENTHEDFLVFPYSKIEEHVARNHIRSDGRGYMVNVTQDEGALSFGHPGSDVTFYKNKWSLIK